MTLGLIPLPKQCQRVIQLPGEGFQFVLLEHAIETLVDEVFSMYAVKHANVICVTRNADLDTTETSDEADDDYREHMKRILKKRSRLAPVRLECERQLSSVMSKFLLSKLELEEHQVFVTSVPLDMGYAWGLAGRVGKETRAALTSKPFVPQWPACLERNRSVLQQVSREGSAAVLSVREHGRVRAAAARGLHGPERRVHQDHALPPGQASRTWQRRSSTPPRTARK